MSGKNSFEIRGFIAEANKFFCKLIGLLLTEGLHGLVRMLGLSLPAFVRTPSFLPEELVGIYTLTSDYI